VPAIPAIPKTISAESVLIVIEIFFIFNLVLLGVYFKQLAIPATNDLAHPATLA
jgi:hypothetical protein